MVQFLVQETELVDTDLHSAVMWFTCGCTACSPVGMPYTKFPSSTEDGCDCPDGMDWNSSLWLTVRNETLQNKRLLIFIAFCSYVLLCTVFPDVCVWGGGGGGMNVFRKTKRIKLLSEDSYLQNTSKDHCRSEEIWDWMMNKWSKKGRNKYTNK